MPEAWKLSTPALAIELAAPPNGTFVAGDTIVGSVSRKMPLVTPEATVTLRLMGRTKTKIEVSRGTYSRDVYRGRFNFFTSIPPEATQRVVWHGPVHIPPSASHATSWPFSVVIPSAPYVSPEPGGRVQESSFLPLTVEDIPRHALPGSHKSSDSGFSTTSECFVEYYLEASLHFSKAKSVEEVKATLPITLRHPTTAYPITDFRPQSREWDKNIRSYLLNPGQDAGRLSFKQKRQKFFGSSKVPQFHFKVCVAVPSIVQLDNQSPLPIQLHIVPKDGPDTFSPTVTLDHISVTLQSDVHVLAPGNFSVHDDHHEAGLFLRLESAFKSDAEPVVIPYGNEPVDVGKLLNLHLSRYGLYSHNKRLCLTPEILPGFTTYNIRHANILKWTVVYTVVGEKHRIEFDSDTIILPPAECGQPPVVPPGPSSPQMLPSPLVSEQLPPFEPKSSPVETKTEEKTSTQS